MTTRLQIQTEHHPISILFPTNAPMSLEEFYGFCQANQELRIERAANGEVLIMPPAFSDTGNRNFNLAVQLGVWTQQDGTGIGFDSSAGFTLPNGAVRSPDASWIQQSRWQELTEEEQASFAPICPDFVIELRSASDSLAALQRKMEEYIENGAILGWLIDRQHRQVFIYRPQKAVETLLHPEQISADPELRDFNLEMEKIW